MGLKYSEAALHAFFMKERRQKTNAYCWKHFSTPRELAREARETEGGGPELEALAESFSNGPGLPGADGMICPFDWHFPVLNPAAPMGDRPFLLFYRGDITLLRDLNRNVAVIGAVDPDESILERERAIVSRLVDEGLTVVSGLAKGCDTAAHRMCLEKEGGKTVAILPTQLGKIYPAQNRALADEIVQQGGLLLTEYAGEAPSKFASVKRFTDRDRLQALFSKAVILIASHRKGEGDSGSRYAMESAKKYQTGRYVMFHREQDEGQSLFGLNQDLLAGEPGVKILFPSKIKELAEEQNPALLPGGEQLRLDL